jgi:hypothetical protein
VNRQPHSDGAKAQARTIFEAHGSRKASEVTGISRRSINAWAKAEGWQRRLATGQGRDQRFHPVSPSGQARDGPAKKAGPGWQPRRVLDRLAWELWVELDTLAAAREAGKSREVRDAAVAVGILVDKCSDLAKQTGADRDGGHPSPEEARDRLRELASAWRQRAEQDGHPDGQ